MPGSLRTGRRKTVALLATSSLVFGGAAAVATPAGAATDAAKTLPKTQPKKDRLGRNDRELLARRESSGVARTTAAFLAEKGQADQLKKDLRALGADIRVSFDKVGYVRVDMPTSRVRKAAGLDRVVAVDLKRTERLPNPTPRQTTPTRAALAGDPAGPNETTPDDNPYMPTNETGSVAFKQAHPTWDGRGVTIGVLDSGVDVEHPALAETTTGDPKIVDWVTATDPISDSDPSWLNMRFEYEVTDGTFRYNPSPSVDITYAAPANGHYLFARLAEQPLFAEGFEGDLNRDGDASDRFGVLWNTDTDDVYVDADGNFDFTNNGDDAAMQPFAVDRDVRYLGADDPGTAIKENVPFTVEQKMVDFQGAELPFVNVGLVAGEHGTHVAGITAANGLFGGDMDGQAPGARVVSSRACLFSGGCTNVALMEGMADLVINRGVDVVNMSIGGLGALNNGGDARAMLYDRLIDQYGVQMFISAGNEGAGVNTIGSPSDAGKVVSVGAAVSRETWQANYGSGVTADMAMFTFSSRGPREDGGFKPNISAPGAAISTIPTWMPGGPVPEAGYDLPPGYAMLNGTSMASPQSAGAAALLISAAKAGGRGYTANQLRRAIYTSAKPFSGENVTAQGMGMFDVPGAWQVLSKNPTTRTYDVSAPVCSPVNELIDNKTGDGIYNRCAASAGGQVVGKQRAYRVTITRHDGTSRSTRHTVTWTGNDGTWSGPSSVTLPRNKPVTITVYANAKSRGVHAAVMKLDDASTVGLDHQIMNTVVLGTDLVASTGYDYRAKTSVERNRKKSYFVVVPEDAKVLTARLTGIAARSQVRFLSFHPWGFAVEDNSSLSCYTNRPLNKCDPYVRSYDAPTPGIWEITVESRRTSSYLHNPFTLDLAIQGVTVTPDIKTLDSVTPGAPAPVSWTVRNDYNSTPVQFHGGVLGSAKSDRPTIAHDEEQHYAVTVPDGAERLDVSIFGGASDDLDLYVEGPNGEAAQSADGDADEAVSIESPAAGEWHVTVHGFDVPAGSAAYDYLDVYFASALGTLTVTAPDTTLGAGQSVAVDGVLTAQQAPEQDRQLFGEMTVETPDGVSLGTGKVIVGSVSGT